MKETANPLDIRFSQSSIKNRFQDKNGLPGQLIGEVLDDIYHGRISLSEIPIISVVKRNETYCSADNRRLWILKKLHELGHIDKITVKIRKRLSRGKAEFNDDVKIRGGDPGGYLWNCCQFKGRLHDRCLKRSV